MRGNFIAFSKAIELLRLADLATSRHWGVTLEDVADAFGVSHRTALRMVQALAAAFLHAVEVTEDPDHRRRWTMRETPLARLQLGGAEELEALEMAAARLPSDGDTLQAVHLESLRDRLLAALLSTPIRRQSSTNRAQVLRMAGPLSPRKIGDRLVVGRKAPRQPHQLLALQPPAGGHVVQVSVDEELEQNRRVIAGSPGSRWHYALQLNAAQVQLYDEQVDDPDQVILADPVLQPLRKQR